MTTLSGARGTAASPTTPSAPHLDAPLTDDALCSLLPHVGRVVSSAGTVVASADLHRAAADVVRAVSALTRPSGAADGFSICAAVRGGRSGPADALATSDDTAGALHVVQHAAAEGPSLAALADTTDAAVVVDDLPTDTRWPGLAKLLSEVGTGVRSVVAASVELPQAHRGVVTVSCGREGVFADAPGLARAQAAAMATGMGLAALLHGRRAENLALALDSNRQIGAAVGVLMSRHRWTYEVAFERLRDISQQSHRKLRDLADDVLLVGDLPDTRSHAGRPSAVAS